MDIFIEEQTIHHVLY